MHYIANDRFSLSEPCCQYYMSYYLHDCPPHAAHGLLRDVVRDSDRVVQGPPGPPGLPGMPGHSRWFSSPEHVVDVVEYIKCKSYNL